MARLSRTRSLLLLLLLLLVGGVEGLRVLRAQVADDGLGRSRQSQSQHVGFLFWVGWDRMRQDIRLELRG